MDSDSALSELEVDHREPVASSEKREWIGGRRHSRVESSEEEVVVPVMRRSRNHQSIRHTR